PFGFETRRIEIRALRLLDAIAVAVDAVVEGQRRDGEIVRSMDHAGLDDGRRGEPRAIVEDRRVTQVGDIALSGRRKVDRDLVRHAIERDALDDAGET